MVTWNQLHPPTVNVWSRVFMIRNQRIGSAFLVEHEERQYLVTAAHNVDQSNPRLDFYMPSGWTMLSSTLLSYVERDDVAILALSEYMERHPAELSATGLFFGQQLFFLGFPFGEAASIANLGYDQPVPFVKWGALAMMHGVNYSIGAHPENRNRLILQGTANEGFSGGPVVFNRAAGGQAICGMIIKQRDENQLVARFNGDSIEEALEYRMPTEFSLACSDGVILNAIKSNPRGTAKRNS